MLFNCYEVYTYEETTVSSLFGYVITLTVYSKTTFKDVLMADVKNMCCQHYKVCNIKIIMLGMGTKECYPFYTYYSKIFFPVMWITLLATGLCT